MITIETPMCSIDQEIAAIEALETGPNMRMYALGVLQTLRWIRDGGNRPSNGFAASLADMKGAR